MRAIGYRKPSPALDALEAFRIPGMQLASPQCSRPAISALTSNPHSARGRAATRLPATSCLGAFWTPAA